MPKYAIMIVDDDEVDRYTLKRFLTSAGVSAKIFEATDGESAIEFLREYEQQRALHGDLFPPIIVLLDINMPRMNGFEFLEEFESLPQRETNYSSIAILMVTSSTAKQDREKAKKFPFVKGYINKMPDSPQEFLSHIEAYLPA